MSDGKIWMDKILKEINVKKYVILGSSLLLVNSVVMAAEDGITSSVEVGLVLTSGNTETRTANVKGKVEQSKGKMRNTVSVEVRF